MNLRDTLRRPPTPTLPRLPLTQERVVIGGVLLFLAALAWAYTVWSAETMDMGSGGMGDAMGMDSGDMAMEMGGMNMRLGVSTSGATLGLLAFLPMWTGMMAAMMFPSAEPMFSFFAKAQRRHAEQGRASISLWVFASGLPGCLGAARSASLASELWPRRAS